MKSLISLGVKHQQIITATGQFLWNILLLVPEDCIKMMSLDLITNDPIICTKYIDRWQAFVEVYEVPIYIHGEHLSIYLMQYGHIVGISLYHTCREQKFDLMLDDEAFASVSNNLEIKVQKYLVIITIRKPMCWKCVTLYQRPSRYLMLWPLQYVCCQVPH